MALARHRRSCLASHEQPRMLRRQSLLPPGAPVRALPGVPAIYDARLALARLWQLYRRVIQAPTLPDGYRWRSEPMPTVVKNLAQDCGLMIGPSRGRIVTTCPSCGHEVYLLRATSYGWACRWCHGERWDQREIMFGSYVMGLRIGLGGRIMRRRRDRIARALLKTLREGRSARDLVILALGGSLMEYSPHWRRCSPGSRAAFTKAPGPVLRRVQSHVLPVMIDQLLHPAAYRRRFAV